MNVSVQVALVVVAALMVGGRDALALILVRATRRVEGLVAAILALVLVGRDWSCPVSVDSERLCY